MFAFLKSSLPGFLVSYDSETILTYRGIKWNFTKFLVGRDGVPVVRYSPTTSPLSMENDIVKELDKPNPFA